MHPIVQSFLERRLTVASSPAARAGCPRDPTRAIILHQAQLATREREHALVDRENIHSSTVKLGRDL